MSEEAALIIGCPWLVRGEGGVLSTCTPSPLRERAPGASSLDAGILLVYFEMVACASL
jgi:hypothetical protein